MQYLACVRAEVCASTYNARVCILREIFRVLASKAGLEEYPWEGVRLRPDDSHSRRELILAVALRHVAVRFTSAASYAPMVCVLAALAGLTWRQTGFWENDDTIFTHTVEIDGDRNDVAHRNIAMYNFEVTHDLEKARHHFDMARKVGNWALLNTLDVYVMTLVELGCEDEITTAFREVEAEIFKQYGEAKARAILAKRPWLSKTEANIAITYRFAQVAAMLGKESQIEAAKRELEDLSDGQENSTIWQYLAWRCLTLTGEKEAAKAMLERLLDPTTKDDFMQFRYLRGSVRSTK